MARSKDQRSHPAAKSVVAPTSFGVDDFAQPDDQGISLSELSQAYAALLKKGADPYPESAAEPEIQVPQEEPAAALELLPAVREEDEAACEITPRSILEAILFVGHPTAEPLTSERIAALMRGVRPSEIDDTVVELNAQYDAEGAPYTIISVGTGYQLTLRPEYASLRDAFYGRIREARLSQAAVEILAIVAYRQPVTGSEIDSLRGKPSGAIIAQLLRRDLIYAKRSSEPKAKPAYCTTGRFLEIFGLEGLADLPQSEGNSR